MIIMLRVIMMGKTIFIYIEMLSISPKLRLRRSQDGAELWSFYSGDRGGIPGPTDPGPDRKSEEVRPNS